MPRRNHPSGRALRRRRHDGAVPPGRGGHRAGDFRCAGCRLDVPGSAPGTAHRNHCPHCLTSLHVDRRVPGDRAAACGGRMEALSVSVWPTGEWMIVHQCLSCGELGTNRISGDDNALALVRLALRPLRDASVTGRVLLTL